MFKTCSTVGLLALAGLMAPVATPAPLAKKFFTKDFELSGLTFSSIGGNEYFRLDPGSFLILEGEKQGVLEHLEITVLDEVRAIGGIDCRVIQEYETKDGELVEISRNFFALCNETKDVFYFGEEVDIYEDGVIVSHDGAWEAFKDGAEPGIIMPGRILHGARYHQEFAPGIAEDRAEVYEYPEKVRTAAGTFTGCVKMEESTPLEPDHFGYKTYAPGIGLVRDGLLKLIAYGG